MRGVDRPDYATISRTFGGRPWRSATAMRSTCVLNRQRRDLVRRGGSFVSTETELNVRFVAER
jgi:hypothetical protein